MIALAGVHAAATTTYNTIIDDETGEPFKCYYDSQETSVTVETQVTADYDGQTEYAWTVNMPGHLQDEPEQHWYTVAIPGYVEINTSNNVSTTSRMIGPNVLFDGVSDINAYQGQSCLNGRATPDCVHYQTISGGDNFISFDFQGEHPEVKAGDIVIVFEGNVCDDELAAQVSPFPIPEFGWIGGASLFTALVAVISVGRRKKKPMGIVEHARSQAKKRRQKEKDTAKSK